MQDLPVLIENEAQLDDLLSRPSPALIEMMKGLEGDLLVLGASGKIGPSLAAMAARAIQAAGGKQRVLAVSRHPAKALAALGIETIACDLLDFAKVQALPRVPNVIFMVGRKFGSTGSEETTWATNILSAYHAAHHFRGARVVAFSTGCVYPVMHLTSGGATEETRPDPVGEYATSCLGRERIFDYYAKTAGLRVLHFRLNYAVELRYGVLVDVASAVWRGAPVDLTTGYANVIWQGDVNEVALRSLELAAAPAAALNVTGPETVSIRDVALEFGRLLGKEPVLRGEENGRGYLSNARRALTRFGYPSVPTGTMMRWIAHWLQHGGGLLGKPTHFEAQDGKY